MPFNCRLLDLNPLTLFLRLSHPLALDLDAFVHVCDVRPRGLRPGQLAHASQQAHHRIAAAHVQLYLASDPTSMLQLERQLPASARLG